jgi:acyl carrier protein
MLTKRPDLTSVDHVVRTVVAKLMAERGLPTREIEDHDALDATLGLRSLDLAQLVFELEMTFGSDPFEKLVPVTSVRTVGDLIGAYRRLYLPSADDEGAAELAEARRESERRRQRRGLPE